MTLPLRRPWGLFADLTKRYANKKRYRFGGDGGRLSEYTLTRVGPGGVTPPTPDPTPDPPPPPPPPPPSGSGTYLLMPTTELVGLPNSGAAWNYVNTIANSSWPAPDLANHTSYHNMHCLAAALVYARTGNLAMRTKARNGIIAAIPTFNPAGNSGLSVHRQISGYVLAADFAELDGADDTEFRAFLLDMLTIRVGTHSAWGFIRETHRDSNNNFGAFAGASRIAADLYLGTQAADLAEAANCTKGFFGDRAAWSDFKGQKNSEEAGVLSWACVPTQAGFTPVNGTCTLSGINVDGAVPKDVWREGTSLTWPPTSTGVTYSLETIAGTMLQAELLYRNGYPTIYAASNQALRRMAGVITRSGNSGGLGWNPGQANNHMPWLLNRRYAGLNLPTVPSEMGRAFGFTDWLYAAAAAAPVTTRPFAAPVTTQAVNVPSSIDATGATDAQPAMQSWFNTVPDGRVINFPTGGIYRMNKGLLLQQRNNLVLRGNGATIQLRSTGGEEYASLFMLRASKNIAIENFTVEGNNPDTTNIFVSGNESQHVLSLNGWYGIGPSSYVEISGVTARNIYADFAYLEGRDTTSEPSRYVWIHNNSATYIGRNSVSPINVTDFWVEDNVFDKIGYHAFDIEPNVATEQVRRGIFRRNTIGSYSHISQFIGMFLGIWTPEASAVSDIEASNNDVSGNPAATYDGSARALNVRITSAQTPRLFSNISILNNRTTRAAAGPVVYALRVDGITVKGNTQPLLSGSFAQFDNCTGVVTT
ncbi:MAG: hypothetical protein H0V50_00800 [Thermoleophilaceae bacterium]|nr:hypothetical protein [Thermoleophilaceae bacterium]